MSANTTPASIESLEPKAVWNFFAGLTTVPRPSKREKKIRAHVRKLAEHHGFTFREEPVGNIIIEVPATPGHESAPITVIQGHLDMVPDNNRATRHDWDNDPITTIIAQDEKTGRQIVHAAGTTLGADNGIGVAMGFAAATSPEVVHGPLELLLTTDEEAGMTGAKALTPDSFRGRRLLNLDSEEDDCIYIGCAGGCDTNLAWRFDTTVPPSDAETCRVTVEGLRGGHSGGDIHEGRANAIRLLTRTLRRAPRGTLHLSEFNGGSKRNAIPREAHAIVSGHRGTVAALQQAAKAVRDEAVGESFEDGIAIRVETITDGDAGHVASADDTATFLSAMAALPDGVLGMHPKVPELVQTSNNVSTVVCESAGGKLKIVVGTLTRSSSGSRMEAVKDQLVSIGRLAAAATEFANDYPGWEPNVESKTLATCQRVYKQLFNEEPHVAAIHAGLECGIIGKRVGKMDMVSFGPTIEGAHSPDERVYVASVAKAWKYLVAVLAELAKG